MLPIIAEQLRGQRIKADILEVTTHEDAVPWFIISMSCNQHGVAIPYGGVCYLCLERAAHVTS